MLSVIVKNTNVYGSWHCESLKSIWHDILVRELKAFLGILIYCSLHSSPQHKDYWNSADGLKPMHHRLTYAFSHNRFLQIEACLHISDPDKKGNVFSKLESVNIMLQDTCKTLWKAGHTLTVDKAMSKFTECAKEIITIPSKPIPTGFKAWILADNGYFLSWVWYAKNDGPQGIGSISKALGRNKIAAVVVYLLKTLPEGPPGIYSVTLDNLFVSEKLVFYLGSQGFGARGTARTNVGIYKDLLNIKRSDEKDKIEWGIRDIRYVANGTVA